MMVNKITILSLLLLINGTILTMEELLDMRFSESYNYNGNCLFEWQHEPILMCNRVNKEQNDQLELYFVDSIHINLKVGRSFNKKEMIWEYIGNSPDPIHDFNELRWIYQQQIGFDLSAWQCEQWDPLGIVRLRYKLIKQNRCE